MPEVRKVGIYGPDKLDTGEHELRWRLFTTDGGRHDRRRRFARKGLADAHAERLRKAEVNADDTRSGRRWGWSERMEPILLGDAPLAEARPDEGDTVWKLITDWRAATWHLQSGNGRKSYAFALRAMARNLVRDEEGRVPPEVDAYLDAIAFRQAIEPSRHDLQIRYGNEPVRYRSGRTIKYTTVEDLWLGRSWLEVQSLPLTRLDRRQLRQLFVAMTDGRKANTERRYWANVKAVLLWGSQESDTEALPRVKPGITNGIAVRAATTTSVDEVGEVPTESEMWTFAWACGTVGGGIRGRERWCALPLVMGSAGLRIGECMALLRRHIREEEEHGGMWIDVRGNRATPGRDWTDTGERHEDRGTKRRGADGNRKGRTTYLRPTEAAILRAHLERFVGPTLNAPVFTRPDGGRPDYSYVDRHVLKLACAMAFGPPHRLEGVTAHGFRHLAVTSWLRSGVPLTTAARWGGWQTVSTMVNFYDSVMPNDDDTAVGTMLRNRS